MVFGMFFAIGVAFGQADTLVVQLESQNIVRRYLVPVAKFTSTRENISFKELKEADLLVSEDIKKEIREILGEGKFSFKKTDEIFSIFQSSINSQSEKIAILPWEDVDFRVKSLSVDGVGLWDKSSDLSKYPLSVLSYVEGDSTNIFSPAKITNLTAAEMIMARKTADRIKAYNSCDWPFDKVRTVLSGADYSIATLEAPFYSNYNFSITGMVFQVDPACVKGVVNSGIDLVSLAANHLGDAGQKGVLETLDLLDKNKIAHVGGGKNESEARLPYYKEINGVKFAFLAYNNVPPSTYAAGENYAGSAWLDNENLKADIAAARKKADIVVVMCHWGAEYTNYPQASTRASAQAAFEAGADLIIGDHPHWVAGLEFMNSSERQAYVTYGIGNFVFDQMWSTETRQGTLQQFYFYGKKLVSVKILPFEIEDWGQPNFVDDYRKTEILNRIWEASKF